MQPMIDQEYMNKKNNKMKKISTKIINNLKVNIYKQFNITSINLLTVNLENGSDPVGPDDNIFSVYEINFKYQSTH